MVQVVQVQHLQVHPGDAELAVGADPVDHRARRAREADRADLADVALDGVGPADHLGVVATRAQQLRNGEDQRRGVPAGRLARLADRLDPRLDVAGAGNDMLYSAYRAARAGVRVGPLPPTMIGTRACAGFGSAGER